MASEHQHLSDSERIQYEKTIKKLSVADKLQKILLWFIAIVAAIGLMVTINAAGDARQEAKESDVRQEQLLNEIRKNGEEQRKVIYEQLRIVRLQMDCVVLFFTQVNRENLTIEDITECTFQRESDIENAPSPLFIDNAPPEVSPTPIPQPSPQPQPTPPPVNQPPEEEEPPTPNCVVDILFVHLLC